MSISSIEDYGLLEYWRQDHNINIWHFNQVSGDAAPSQTNDEVYTRVMRDYIARELNRSFWTLARYLNYPILPVYIDRTEQIRLSRGVPYERQRLNTRFKHLTAFGSRATTLIQAGANVEYTDEDGDGVSDTGTITVNSTLVDADEIQIFFRVADGASAAAHQLWQIRPATVSKSGNVATITAHRAEFVQPSYVKRSYDAPNFVPNDKNVASTTTNADFVDAVDVYRVYTDSTDAVQIVSDPWIDTGDRTASSPNLTSVSPLIEDGESATFMLRPALSVCKNPEHVRVNYKAGFPLDLLSEPDQELVRAIIALTDANLPMTMDGTVDPVVNSYSRWRNEARVPQRYVNNPFGTLEGQLEAWRIVEHRAYFDAGKVSQSRRIW